MYIFRNISVRRDRKTKLPTILRRMAHDVTSYFQRINGSGQRGEQRGAVTLIN